jgi:hypothetical protein
MMKPHKKVLLGLLICGVAAVLIAGASGRSQSNRQQASNSADPPRIKTLREIGQERDVESVIPNLEFNNEYSDLQSLAKRSSVIVVGHITQEASSFPRGDSTIITTYTVDIQRVLKDSAAYQPLGPNDARPLPLTSPLKFVREGGVMHVNGHRVSRKLKGSELLTAGKDYVLFLEWSPAFESYFLMAGSSGAFLIQDNSKIKPLGSEKGLLQHEAKDLEAFIHEVLSAPAL